MKRDRSVYRANNRAKNNASSRRSHIRSFGIEPEDYERMHTEQNGVCAICRRPCERDKCKLSIDHCHDTGRVRGLLCNRCNVGLGRFRDEPALLRFAADYLERV